MTTTSQKTNSQAIAKLSQLQSDLNQSELEGRLTSQEAIFIYELCLRFVELFATTKQKISIHQASRSTQSFRIHVGEIALIINYWYKDVYDEEKYAWTTIPTNPWGSLSIAKVQDKKWKGDEKYLGLYNYNIHLQGIELDVENTIRKLLQSTISTSYRYTDGNISQDFQGVMESVISMIARS